LLEVSGGKERMLHYWHQRDPDMKELEPGARKQVVARLHEIKTAAYEARVAAGAVQLRPGVLALMEAAQREGLLMAIATTTSPVNIGALLRPVLGPDWRLNFAAIGDASTAPLKKPHPQVYQQVLREIGKSPGACIALEDSHNGLRAALAAGVAAVVTPTHFTAHQDFTGALSVRPDLQGLTLATLRAWLAERGAVPA
jgi:beta-phosphoglucomutase-like phosphatase (HAD superfamily)